jgi:hypothetical protein
MMPHGSRRFANCSSPIAIDYYGGIAVAPDLARGCVLWPQLRILRWDHRRRFELVLPLPWRGLELRAAGDTNAEALHVLDQLLGGLTPPAGSDDHRSVQ